MTLDGSVVDDDGALGAVGRRPAGDVLLARGHQAVAEDDPVALVVGLEQVGARL